MRVYPYLQLLFVLLSDSHYFLYVFREPEFSQGFIDVFRSDGFLSFTLSNLICLRRYQGDEFDTAFDKQIAGFFSESCARADGEYLRNDFLDRSYTFGKLVYIIYTLSGSSVTKPCQLYRLRPHDIHDLDPVNKESAYKAELNNRK